MESYCFTSDPNIQGERKKSLVKMPHSITVDDVSVLVLCVLPKAYVQCLCDSTSDEAFPQ